MGSTELGVDVGAAGVPAPASSTAAWGLLLLKFAVLVLSGSLSPGCVFSRL